MKNLISAVQTYISDYNLIPQGSTIILGLSGGPDSIFLLHALLPLHEQGWCTLVAAHLDHEWRADSYKDAEFCQKLAQSLGIKLVTRKIAELSLHVKFNGSKEEVGRTMRRHFFELVKTEHSADRIALAHHADDQQETFFIRLMRGSSLTGLTCMKPHDGGYIRPLLTISKAEILEYLNIHTIPFMHDPSNESDAFLRNRIRSKVIPALKASDNRFDANFAATLTRLQESESLLANITQDTLKNLCQENPMALDFKRLLHLQPSLQYRVLMQWFCINKMPFTPSQAFLDEILRFLHNIKSSKHAIHTTWQLEKKDSNLSLQRIHITFPPMW